MPRVRAISFVALTLWVGCLHGQYDKVAALGSDSALTPIGGPASSPGLLIGGYDLPDLRPTGKLNDQLPHWIQFGLEERVRFEGFREFASDGYTLNRLRFGAVIQPVRWFKTVAQLQDARSFWQPGPAAPPNNVRWDLKLAYAQIGDLETQALSLTVGRQLIDYNSTIIGNSEWRNQARSYDGVVANVRVDRFRAAVFAASIVDPILDGISHHQQGNNVYGIYGWITRVVPKSSIEPFVLRRVAPSMAVEASPSKTAGLREDAYGFRIRGTDLANIDYRYELVLERGMAGANCIGAWASTAGAGYKVKTLAGTPRLFGGYDFASGDRNGSDGVRGTFDTMYPTAHDRFGIADQFGWQNILAWRAGATIFPHRRWSITGQYVNLWLARATDGAYNSSGGLIARDASGKAGRHIGEEYDVYTWYEVNRQVHVGAGVGHIAAGNFMANAARAGGYSYPYLVVEILDGKRVR